MSYRKGFFYGLMIALIIAAVAGLFAALFMQLWNWLIPVLFSGPVLTYWQAVGLLVLAKIIFGGFGTGHHKKRWKSHGGWRGNWKDRCSNMSEEDKEKWKSHFMHKWNCVREDDKIVENKPEETSTS